MIRKDQSGQALVLVLLSLSVVLTLVLFVLSRSVTDIAVSSGQEESVRAFSAAEAGIEEALVTGQSNGNSIGGSNASYTANVSPLAEDSTEFTYPSLLSSGDSATIWFAAHDGSGNLTSAGAFTGDNIKVCWGNSGTQGGEDATPAIEVSIYYEDYPGDISTVRIARVALDPNSGRTVSNSFESPEGTCQIGGTRNFAFNKSITFNSLGINQEGLLFARIRMFYNNTPQGIGVSVAGDTLPSQGQQIDSSGVAGGSNRRIVVYQGWPEFPFASNALLVPAGIIK